MTDADENENERWEMWRCDVIKLLALIARQVSHGDIFDKSDQIYKVEKRWKRKKAENIEGGEWGEY